MQTRGLLGPAPPESVSHIDDLLAPEQGVLDSTEASTLQSAAIPFEDDDSEQSGDDSSFDAESMLESLARDAQREEEMEEDDFGTGSSGSGENENKRGAGAASLDSASYEEMTYVTNENDEYEEYTYHTRDTPNLEGDDMEALETESGSDSESDSDSDSYTESDDSSSGSSPDSNIEALAAITGVSQSRSEEAFTDDRDISDIESQRPKPKKPKKVKKPKKPKVKKKKIVYDEDTTRRRKIACILIGLLLLLIGIGAGIAVGLVSFGVEPRSSGRGDVTYPPVAAPTLVISTPPPTDEPTKAPAIAPVSVQPMAPAPTYADPYTENIIRGSSGITPAKAFEDPDSVQSKALEWLKSNQNLPFYSPEKQLARWALAVFYYSTNGDDWLDNFRWLSDFDECTWYAAGVPACNADRKFSNLVLGANDLVGTLPAEIGLLSNGLEAINVRGLSSLNLNGTLPDSLRFLTMLKELSVPGNSFTGTIPSALRGLDALEELDFNGNKYKGKIPGTRLSSIKSLKSLNLGDCDFTGEIPTQFGKLKNLTSLVLHGNGLNGTIPEQLGNLDDLEVLDLDDNELTFIPRIIGDLTNLKTLSVANNKIQGTVHTEFGRLMNLEGFFISNNEFGYQIPSEFGQLTKLRDGFDVSMNQLIGSVPAELGALTELRQFRITGNRIAGTLPDSLSALSQLRVFRVDENDLIGDVPPALCQGIDVNEATAYADCNEVSCPCCTHCCADGFCRCQIESSDPMRCAGTRL